MKQLSLLASATIVLLSIVYAAVSFAATVNGTLGVKAVVGAGCQVNSGSVTSGAINFGDLDFGSINTINSQHVDAQSSGAGNGSIMMECSNGTTFTISLDNGQHYAGGIRSMANTTNASILLNYSLYQNVSRTVPWTTSSPLSGTSPGTATTFNVYGRIPGGQSGITSGTYNDTIQVVISW